MAPGPYKTACDLAAQTVYARSYDWAGPSGTTPRGQPTCPLKHACVATMADVPHPHALMTNAALTQVAIRLHSHPLTSALALVPPLSIPLTLSPHAPQPTWHPEGCTVGYVMQHQYAISLRDLDTRWLGGVACVLAVCV